MSNRFVLAALPLLLAGCPVGNVTEDNFADKYAQAQCQNMKSCNPVMFYVDPDDLDIDGDAADAYPQGDMADCIDYYTEQAEDLWDLMDDADCDFDEDKATECLNGASGSCKDYAENIEDVNDSCNDMFDCG